MVPGLKVNDEWRASSTFIIEEIDIAHGFRIEGINSAIHRALQWIIEREGNNIETHHHRNFVILTDSMSALNSLENRSIKDRHLIFECWKLIEKLIDKGLKDNFQRVPSHTGISGNKKADKLAKDSLQLQNISRVLIWNNMNMFNKRYS